MSLGATAASGYHRATIEDLCQRYLTALEGLIEHCLLPEAGGCTPSDFPLAILDQAELDSIVKEPRNVEDIYPLGSMQEGLLLHTLMSPHSGIYLMQDRYAIQGHLDMNAFRNAWQQVVDTHAVLRTAFVWNLRSKPHQIVYKKADVPFEVLDWRELSSEDQELRLHALLQHELAAGLPLDRAPVLRIRLIRLDEERWIFARSHHHVLLDAWCLSLLLVDFLAYYEAWLQGQPLPEKKITPYREYIQWLQRQDIGAAEVYWRESLKGFNTPSYLSSLYTPVSVAEGEPKVADEILSLSRADTQTLRALAGRHQITPNTFLQAAWALLMAHYLDRREVLFGVTVAGRPPEIEGIEDVVGLFINSLPLRVSVQPELTCLEWLKTLLAQNLAMHQFEYAQLSEIQRWSEVVRGQALFDSLVVFENVPVDPSLRGHSLALDIQGYETRTHTNYPLTVVLIPGDELHLQITYDRALFDSTGVARILGHYKASLEALVRHPEARLGELRVLSEAERNQILSDWSTAATETPPAGAYQARFEAQVAQTPEAIAAVCGEESITYAELNARANRVAHGLMAAGAGPDAVVALLDERGIDFLTMILGVFKTGGAYIPLDPNYPASRLRRIIELSRPGIVLTRTAYRSDWIATGGQPEAQASPAVICIDELMAQSWPSYNPPVAVQGGNLAYVIYTSGSTGDPKGVLIEQRGLMNNILSKIEVLGLMSQDAIAQTASQCFDISVWQFLTALVCGARVEIFPDGISHDPLQLLRSVKQRGITVLELVPSMMAGMIEAMDGRQALPALRWLLPTGEALPAPVARRWMASFPGVALLNAYGPAECSDDVAYHRLVEAPAGDGIVPIGRPITGLRLYLLNRYLQPVPAGVPGELYIAGAGVGRGYLGRPDLTAAGFIPDPFATKPGERLYRSGDRARYRSDGAIEFLGRIDHQVKIRGHRIELGEIEARLVEHPLVREAVVSARACGAGDQRLAAYIVPVATSSPLLSGENKPAGSPGISTEEVRTFLKQSLPDYRVPSTLVFLEQLPRTPNGKVDRNALPAPDFTHLPQTCHVAPRTPIEAGLAAIWAEVLKLERVCVEDDFFEL
ncbi:MAG: amino acid adenylation domain-containing protein, partial [Burkholderiales bacterium]